MRPQKEEEEARNGRKSHTDGVMRRKQEFSEMSCAEIGVIK